MKMRERERRRKLATKATNDNVKRVETRDGEQIDQRGAEDFFIFYFVIGERS